MAKYIVQVQVIDLDLPPQPSGAPTPVLYASSPYAGELHETVQLYLLTHQLVHQMLSSRWLDAKCPSCYHPLSEHGLGTCNADGCLCDYLGRGDD